MPLEAACCSHRGRPHSASQYVNNGGDSFSLPDISHCSADDSSEGMSSHKVFSGCTVLMVVSIIHPVIFAPPHSLPYTVYANIGGRSRPFASCLDSDP